MKSIPSQSCDWVVAFFLCCVLPEELQGQAVAEFARVKHDTYMLIEGIRGK